MKYTEPGEHTLVYKAVDECGNTTEQIRTVEVVDVPKTTTLFTDGTLIINERSTDRDANVTKHGAMRNEYAPLDSTNTYVFNGTSERPWHDKGNSIIAVEFGSTVSPLSIAYWFQSCPNLESIDWTNFDGSNCTSARAFAASTKITNLTLPKMPNLTSIRFICNACPNLTSVDMSDVNASGMTDINAAFQACYALETVDISGLAGTIEACANTFSNASNGADMILETIYANPNLDCSQATAYNNMFRACTSLVGGAGTVYEASHIGRDYARIDNPPSSPGYFTQKGV